MAQALGADVLSIITPSFAAASQDELYEHYRAVAEAVDMPIVLYNIPARTGNALAPATVARLSRIDNIVGAKDSSGNFDNMLQYIEQTREGGGFAVLSGNDSLILWNLLAGGLAGLRAAQTYFRKRWRPFTITLWQGDMEMPGKGPGQHPFLPRMFQVRQSQYHCQDSGGAFGISGRKMQGAV